MGRTNDKALLSAAQIKLNTNLRKRIRMFLVDKSSDDPSDVLSFLSDHAEDVTLLAPVEMADEDRRRFLQADENDSLSFEISMKLIEDDDGDSWIPAFTSREASVDEDGEAVDLLPFSLEDLYTQVKDAEDEISGIVIDPWSNAFPMPEEVMQNVFSDAGMDDSDAGLMLVKGDITEMDCDAVVNSSNNTLSKGVGGVDKDVHDAAGEGLSRELASLHGCKTGEAKITDAYGLPCKYIIHTVGPIWSDKGKDEEELAACYDSCLYVAREHGLHSIAFPCISTGNFGYPKQDACEIAVDSVIEWLSDNDDYEMSVIFCCKDDENFAIYQKYLNDELGDPDEN